jgi:hypothetical protein
VDGYTRCRTCDDIRKIYKPYNEAVNAIINIFKEDFNYVYC